MKFLSQVYTAASGSVGGVTYSRNRGGMYTRARSVPTNPNSNQQQTVRSAMTALVANWQSLPAAQREAWTTYASNTPRTDRLGQALTLTGQQQYVAVNTPRLSAGLGVVNVAPTEFNRGNPVTSVGSFSVGNIPQLTDSLAGGASDDGQILVYVSRPISGAVNYFRGPYRFALSEAVSSGSTGVGISGFVTDPYGSPYTVGEVRCWRLTVAYDDGRVSEAYEQILTVSA